MIKKENIASLEAIVQQKGSPLFEESSELVCPHCSHTNENGGTYCAECGAILQQPATCPKCNAVARPRADICEACGTWLLKGQCMFCYAQISENENFCGECGNPIAGITCQRCGKLSIFDFCKSCGTPLSIQAKEMVQEIMQDPDFKEMVSLFEQLGNADDLTSVTTNVSDNVDMTNTETISSLHDNQVFRLKAYREAVHKSITEPKPKLASKALFSGEQKARIHQLNKEIFKEEERKRIEEEKRKQEEERNRREAEERRRKDEVRRREQERRVQALLNEMGGKTFSSNQEARRFFMNIIAGLPEEVKRKITDRGMGWRCNAYGCVHNSPGECADPSRGGVWLLR
jgi:predicted amidophosphoribosyltransferase